MEPMPSSSSAGQEDPTEGPTDEPMNDETEDSEYEDVFVYADLHSLIHADEMTEENIKIIGMDTEHPIIQVNGKIFKGEYDFAMGTNLFMEIDPKTYDFDPVFDKVPENFYRLYQKSNKVLAMKRIFVENKNEFESVASGESGDIEVAENSRKTFVPSKTYEEALGMFLGPGEEAPRKI